MPPKDFFVINYAHVRHGVFYHGTVSQTDGVVQSTWTVQRDGQKVTEPGQITADGFRQLWDDVASAPVFEHATVRDPNTALDFERFHLVGIAFKTSDQNGARTFLVPTGETDATFVRWLSILAVPA